MQRRQILIAVIGATSLGLAGCAANMADDGMMSSDAQASTATIGSASMGGALARTSTRGSVMVGGQPMYANRTIADNAVNAPNLSQVVSLLQRAGLVDTLRGAGPFTVLAPNNDAFTRVPAETMGRVGASDDLLRRTLTYHVLSGRYTRTDIIRAIRAGGGTASFETVNGATLRARMQGDIVVLEGNNNSIAYLQQFDVPASNDIVHVINGVLIPPSANGDPGEARLPAHRASLSGTTKTKTFDAPGTSPKTGCSLSSRLTTLSAALVRPLRATLASRGYQRHPISVGGHDPARRIGDLRVVGHIATTFRLLLHRLPT